MLWLLGRVGRREPLDLKAERKDLLFSYLIQLWGMNPRSRKSILNKILKRRVNLTQTVYIILILPDSVDRDADGQVLRFGQNFRLGITGGFEDKMVSRQVVHVLGSSRFCPGRLAAAVEVDRELSVLASVCFQPAPLHRHFGASSYLLTLQVMKIHP